MNRTRLIPGANKRRAIRMVDILNRQRKLRLRTEGLGAFAAKAAGLIESAAGKEFSVVFVSDDRIRKLNSRFRGKNRPTDVLSFPFGEDYDGFLGDIVISAEKAAEQAAANGLTLELEIRQLILHGLLHLAGYDHETDSGEMNALEMKLRKKLEIDL